MTNSGRTEVSPLRILVVEDDPISGHALANLLSAEGFHARWVPSLPKALRAASEWLPDVLLCDLDLGSDRDGGDVFATLRSAHPGLFAISISGHAPVIAARRSREAGFAAHLVKPLDMQKVLQLVRSSAGTLPS